ncbi:MAG: YeiH family protein [Defluviitaleaceae bacterium]|nr:YeiH family protein [Defluviitaleaceae bacterium]
MEILYILPVLLLTLPITTPSFYKRENWAGILLCLGLAFLAWYLGQMLPLVGGPVLGILIGLIITNLWKNQEAFTKGIKISSKRVLQTAIVLFGFQMNLGKVFEMGRDSIVIILVVITVAFGVAIFAGKALKIAHNEKMLIGIGTAICGGSAIAATAPVLSASDKEVVRAISTIFLFNILAAFLFPILGRAMGMSDTMFGIWAGAAINDTSSVVAAGYVYSDTAGDVATIVKLTRTIMIIPLTLCIAFIRPKEGSSNHNFNILKSFPWFVLAFLLASVINTTGIIPIEVTSFWGRMGRFLIITAMVAIGFGCNIKELIKGGKRPIFLGFLCSLSVGIVALILINTLD